MSVPFPPDDVRRVLSDTERLHRCVPGLQVDASADRDAVARGNVPGRLRLRVGGSTITYRGVLRIGKAEGRYRVEAEGREARGEGTVKAVLSIELEAVDGGTNMRMRGTATATGRIAQAGGKAVSAVTRLLDRSATELTATVESLAAPGTKEPGRERPPSASEPGESAAGPSEPEPAQEETAVPPESSKARRGEPEEGATEEPAERALPHDGTTPEDTDTFDAASPVEPGEPAIERAKPVDGHCVGLPALGRRTMIGRSAEEVDHVPPRGRYAPEPSPEAVCDGNALRWAAPAVAALLACVMVVRRLLRGRERSAGGQGSGSRRSR